jgi:ComF family protein
MTRSISLLFYSIIGALIPPRGSERIVSCLTLAGLESKRTEDGLPYHDKSVQALVWELKYNKNPRALMLAGELLAEALLGVAEDEIGTPLLIPVPMHAARRRERGHNQTEALCEAALTHMGGALEYMPHALARTQYTQPQQKLPRRMRLKNVQGSMEAGAPEKIKGRVCIVVDDVATTGATLAEAARALKKAGARRVHALALARS